MGKKVGLAMMLTLLLVLSMLTLACNIQPVNSDWTWTETIYIRADGSIEPDTAPISIADNTTYTLTENIVGDVPEDTSAIVVERDNIILAGAGFTLQGTGGGIGMNITERRNITVRDMRIKAFSNGIVLWNSSESSVSGNNITNNDCGVGLSDSSSNTVSGNNITNNDEYGIYLGSSSGNNISANNIANNIGTYGSGVELSGGSSNTVSGNNITNNESGVWLWESSGNTVSGNNITNNDEYGVVLERSSFSTVSGNNITNNKWSGVVLYFGSRNNSVYHNNFLYNEKYQTDVRGGYANTWDDGYPSGGNYWSDYNGTDTNDDGIGDTPYIIDADNQDRYPLMSPWILLEHELVASIMAPTSLWLGSSSSLNATVINKGSSDETDLELELLINGTTTDSATISLLQAGDSYTLSYLWTATAEGTYNVTAYVHPVLGEASVENNQVSGFMAVSAPPEVGVKAGDWIKVEYTVSGWPSGQPYPEWLKVEFLSVEGTSATVRVTMRMSDGTEQSDTVPVDVVAGGQALGLSGFVIPANLTTGDSVYITGYDNITIEDETTRTYAGASRTAVYASFSQYGTQLTYYWDKQTGVMVEASTTSGGVTATAKATETNMWQAQRFGLPIDPTVFYALIIVAIVIVASLAFFMIRRRKKIPEVAPSQS